MLCYRRARLTWEDVLPVIKQRMTFETMVGALSRPEEFYRGIVTGTSPVGPRSIA
jgi:hypothetical protein